MTTPWCTCFETECITTVQGHPRSLILAPIEILYRTTYWSSGIRYHKGAGLYKTAP